ncbi:MAG: spermidine synthase [Planctomycetota bacterium]
MSGPNLHSGIWVTEYVTPHDVYVHGVERVFVSKKTTFQEMAIVEGGAYGKALVLDGMWQSCTGEEFLYHEPLVHVPCLMHGAPKRVLVLGGGEGATVREALKWSTVEHVAMVDIDGDVVEACKEFLPEMHQGAFDDPRTELVIGDALEFLDNASDYDVIISDLTDAITDGPSFELFTKEYYGRVRSSLAPGGVFVVQAGPVSPAKIELHARIYNTVASVFSNVGSYTTPTATYGSPWGYVLGRDDALDLAMSAERADEMLRERVRGELRMLDGHALVGLLHVNRFVRDAYERYQEPFTLASPPSFHDAAR